MKTRTQIVVFVALLITLSCKKEDLNWDLPRTNPLDSIENSNIQIPSITTAAINSVSMNSASSGGIGINDFNKSIISKGVCWGTSSNPTISNSHTNDGTGNGDFGSQITGLSSNTTYYVRAYATNNSGTGYGENISFVTTTIQLATISTISPFSISSNSAVSGGNIISNGGTAIISSGICWATAINPTISDTHSTDGTASGNFQSQMINLNPNSTYHVRAYATTAAGTSYGQDISFTTSSLPLPILTTNSVSNISFNSATSGGNISSNGGSTITSSGICWSTSSNPTVMDSHTTDGTASGSFQSQMINLNPNSTYHVRAYATTAAGTSYGQDISFTTSIAYVIPTVQTTGFNNVTDISANISGNVTSDGGSNVISRGICYGLNQNPTFSDNFTTEGNGLGNFQSSISGLIPNAIYYARAYATNSIGTAYGVQVSFVTTFIPDLPVIITKSIDNSYNTGGNIISDGGGVITGRGVCYGLSPNPTLLSGGHTNDGIGSGNFDSQLPANFLNGLDLYFARAYATNSAGTSYGNQISFYTELGSPAQWFNSNAVYGNVKDADSNSYRTIEIGVAEWMAENLRTTKFSNGDNIPNISGNASSEAWVYINNSASAEIPKGKLYNYYAVIDNRNLCPTGWHIPTNADWTTLENFLGGTTVAGAKLKSTNYWFSGGIAGSNISGFSGVPAGAKIDGNSYIEAISKAYWWSSTPYSQGSTNLYLRSVNNSTDIITTLTSSPNYSYSVRCVRD